MKPWKLIILRLLVACLFGGVVAALALSAGQRAAQHSVLEVFARRTPASLSLIVSAIDAYRQKTHSLPRSLSQVKVEQDSDCSQIQDGWGRPFVYIVQGTHYQVISYGQDGKPGGDGWDADISSDNPHPPKPQMTFHNFLTNPYTQDMVETACISGILAGLLCFLTVRFKQFTGRSILTLGVQIIATLAAASLVAMMITAAHVPSGH